jgi:hypothetical protein
LERISVSYEIVPVIKGSPTPCHWFLKFEEIRAVPSKFPVLAGFNVSGELKYCEKWGSCALIKKGATKNKITIKVVFNPKVIRANKVVD